MSSSPDHVRTNTPQCRRKPEHCDECGNEHPIVGFCPFVPCKICYKSDHYIAGCTFPRKYKRGENFDTKTYEIVCHCNMPFDTDNWRCNYCCRRGHPKLQIKICKICNDGGDHITFDCPKDKELAKKLESKFHAIFRPRESIPWPEYLRMRDLALAAASASSNGKSNIAPDDDIPTFNKMRRISVESVDPKPPTN